MDDPRMKELVDRWRSAMGEGLDDVSAVEAALRVRIGALAEQGLSPDAAFFTAVGQIASPTARSRRRARGSA